jgi:hypothetical protein
MLVVACAGGQHPGKRSSASYDKAVAMEDACCDKLDMGGATSCKQGVMRVDPETRGDDLNRETFACVASKFVCDPTTGKATKSSAQAQLDCIDDLRSSRAISP